jgi:hypothetical protein
VQAEQVEFMLRALALEVSIHYFHQLLATAEAAALHITSMRRQALMVQAELVQVVST